MREIRMGYYKVLVSQEFPTPACIDLDKLADILPHGSGIDGDWHFTVRKNGDVHIACEVHAMNENGYYDGWTTWTATIRKAKRDEMHPLIGRMEGYSQVTRRAGDIYLSGGTSARGYGDWIYETVDSNLHDAGILSPSPRSADGAFGLCIDAEGKEFPRSTQY